MVGGRGKGAPRRRVDSESEGRGGWLGRGRDTDTEAGRLTERVRREDRVSLLIPQLSWWAGVAPSLQTGPWPLPEEYGGPTPWAMG